MKAFQSIFSALLVGIGGAFVVVGGADGVGAREDAARHGLLGAEAVVLGFGHFVDFGLAG